MILKMIDVLFFIPAILFLISGLPQTFRIVKRKSSCDISSTTYIITFIAILIVVINAVYEEVWTIAISNGVSLITVGVNLFLILYYKKNV